MRLYIDSGTHSFTDTEGRIDGIEKRLRSVDVVFTEDSDADTMWGALKLILTAPLLVSVMLFYVKIGLPIARSRWGNDRDIENYLTEAYDADQIPTDRSILEPIRSLSQGHFASNWLMVCIACILWLQYNLSLFTILSLFVASGVALFLTFLSGVHESRNIHIAREISRYQDEYEEACLVTGKEHHAPVGTLLEQYDGIDVLNPTPEDT